MVQADRAPLSVSDAAYWIAALRAQESARRDALFQDPYAGKLASEGPTPPNTVPSWALVTRTELIDDVVLKAVGEGPDRVLNLAAGLETRPYRLPLPAALSWVEADLAGILQYKERVLDSAVPGCQLSREVIDLADAPRRRAFLERALAGAKRALVITERLLTDLNAELVASFAQDFSLQKGTHAGTPSRWPGAGPQARSLGVAALGRRRAFVAGVSEHAAYFALKMQVFRGVGVLGALRMPLNWHSSSL